MTLQRVPPATPLARTVDLGRDWNAGDARRRRAAPPAVRTGARPPPERPVGVPRPPLRAGSALGRPTLDPARPRRDDRPPAAGGRPDGHRRRRAAPVSHLVVAHFADSWRDADREPAARHARRLGPPGRRAARDLRAGVRRRPNPGDHGAPPVRDRRRDHRLGVPARSRRSAIGRMSRSTGAGRTRGHPRAATRPPGTPGRSGCCPAAWGPAQTGVADFVPTPDDDITYWLHAIPLAPGEVPVSLRLVPLGDGRPGHGRGPGGRDPCSTGPRTRSSRRRVGSSGSRGPERTCPTSTSGWPSGRAAAGPDDGGCRRRRRDRGPIGWGRPRGPAGGCPRPAGAADRRPRRDAGCPPPARRLGAAPRGSRSDGIASSRGRTEIRALPAATVRVDVRVTRGRRIRRRRGSGSSPPTVGTSPPLGHRDEVNPGSWRTAGPTSCSVRTPTPMSPATFQVDLPLGAVDVEVVKGFDHRPARGRGSTSDPTTRADARPRARHRPPRRRLADLRSRTSTTSRRPPRCCRRRPRTWRSSTCSRRRPATTSRNGQDLAWGSQRGPDRAQHAVMSGRRTARTCSATWRSSGRTGRSCRWHPAARRRAASAARSTSCSATGPTAAAPRAGSSSGPTSRCPTPRSRRPSSSGRIDAVEMQIFAPGLDNPPILEWYRFLNCGYRLPVLGGTDKMSAEVPVGAIRTYARLRARRASLRSTPGPPPFAPAARSQPRARCSSSPSTATSRAPRSRLPVVRRPARGPRPGARGAAGRRLARGRDERARRRSPRTPPPRSADLALAATIEVTAGAWIAARSRSDHEIHSAFATTMAAHTSPVYVEVADRPLFDAGDAAAIVEVIDGTARWLETMAAVADPGRSEREWSTGSAPAARTLRDRHGTHETGGRPDMRIALDPYMLRDRPFGEVCRIAADIGYDAIELSPRPDFIPFFTHPRADRAQASPSSGPRSGTPGSSSPRSCRSTAGRAPTRTSARRPSATGSGPSSWPSRSAARR